MRTIMVSLFLIALVVVSASAEISGVISATEFTPPTGASQTAEQLAAAQAALVAVEKAKAQAEADLQVANTEKARLERELQEARSARTAAVRHGDNAGAERHRRVAITTSSQLAAVEAHISSIEARVKQLEMEVASLNGYDHQLKLFGDHGVAQDWGYCTEGQLARKYGLTPVGQSSQPPASAGATQPPPAAEVGGAKMAPWLIAVIVVASAAVLIALLQAIFGVQLIPVGWLGAARAAFGLGPWGWGPNVRGRMRVVAWTRNGYMEEERQRHYRP